MAVQQTFSIIKPDATKRNLTGKVNAVIEEAGLKIVAQKRVILSRREAETFYGEHKERPFFGELVDFMISKPVLRRLTTTIIKKTPQNPQSQQRLRYRPRRSSNNMLMQRAKNSSSTAH